MPPSDVKECSTCKFARPGIWQAPSIDKAATLICCIDPPVADLEDSLGYWPAVRPVSWCAKWEKKA